MTEKGINIGSQASDFIEVTMREKKINKKVTDISYIFRENSRLEIRFTSHLYIDDN